MPPGHVHGEGCAVIPESGPATHAPRTPTSHVNRTLHPRVRPDLVERVSLKAEGRQFDPAPDHSDPAITHTWCDDIGVRGCRNLASYTHVNRRPSASSAGPNASCSA
jgi:hypothetical protein